MSPNTAATADVNPAIAVWTGPFGLPQFGSINDRDFKAAFAAALPAHLAEIEAIADESGRADVRKHHRGAGDGPAQPLTKDIEHLLESGRREYERDIAGAGARVCRPSPVAPPLRRSLMNRALFGRIDALYQNRESLSASTPKRGRVLELTWKSFVRSGAELSESRTRTRLAVDQRASRDPRDVVFAERAGRRDATMPWCSKVHGRSDGAAGLPDFQHEARRPRSVVTTRTNTR